ncbi:hypothetical protein HELRODRAFT_185103 [Helobdella robusta]|uniref:Calponin-homology (CH) domain-containing protein n=1 Tax=Helobdella robusta TaxID=6412 RepID=T1FME4_HELRO|nr:hypothetical protein HELRODRAFT_185103 [Helobdella robusta]ESN94208.1 hypothetical protein HELRODRAFT_185103 [Helobdella robusta]
MSRNASSDRVAIRSKVAAKYDKTAETEVLTWFEKLIDVKLEPGTHKLEKQLRNGQHLVQLAQKIQSDTLNCPEKARKMVLKFNTDNMPFKQMENIQTFLAFCENYGVPKMGIFHPKDLYEGRNLSQVLSCIQQLGSECQRNGFSGPCIGPKPLEKNIREFSEEKLRAGNAIIGMQAGSHKGASQSGMHTGARLIVDSRTEVQKDSAATSSSTKSTIENGDADEKKPKPMKKPSATVNKDNLNGDEKVDENGKVDDTNDNRDNGDDDNERKKTEMEQESENSEDEENEDMQKDKDEEIEIKQTKEFVYDESKPADEKIKERTWRKNK